MGWEYFILLDDNILEESFGILLQQCCINKDRLLLHLNKNNCYRFLINTEGYNDRIYCKNGKYMLKSRFMTSRKFKKCLIEYYREYGVYVTGPKELRRQDGSIMDKWIIELTLSVKK